MRQIVVIEWVKTNWDNPDGPPKKINKTIELHHNALRFHKGNVYYFDEEGQEKYQAWYLFHRSPQYNIKGETIYNEPDLSPIFMSEFGITQELGHRPNTIKVLNYGK